MTAGRKVEKIMIAFSGARKPRKANRRAMKRLKRGGKLVLLHITDDYPIKSLRYKSGQMKDSETVRTLSENLRNMQRQVAREYAEESRKKADGRFSTEIMCVSGDPVDEILKAVENRDIDLVFVSNLREGIFGLLFGGTKGQACESIQCEAVPVSD